MTYLPWKKKQVLILKNVYYWIILIVKNLKTVEISSHKEIVNSRAYIQWKLK